MWTKHHLISREKLENVKTFKYLGAMLTKHGTIVDRYSKKDILIILATSTAAIVRFEKILKVREIEFNLKYKLYRMCIHILNTIYFTAI